MWCWSGPTQVAGSGGPPTRIGRAITVGRQRFGHSVQSEVSVLREECRLPFRVIQRYLKRRFGLGLSVGELVALTRGAAEHGREEYGRLRQEIRASPVVYGDRAGGKMAVMGISGVSARQRCATSSTGPAGAGRWWRRCWGTSSRGVGQRLLRSLQRVSGAAPKVLDPSVAGHPPLE